MSASPPRPSHRPTKGPAGRDCALGGLLRRTAVASLSLAVVAVPLDGCGGNKEEPVDEAKTLLLEGSDTMLYLSKSWAEAFQKDHPEATVKVLGGGSGRGIAALLNGEADLANASRPMREREKFLLMQGRSKTAREFPVGLDALAVFVNQNNPVASLTIPQLRGIYTGQIDNWKDVGGPDLAIAVYNRDEASGTYAFVQDHVLDGAPYTDGAEVIPETANIIKAVEKARGGIGYGGVAYVEDEAHPVKGLKIGVDDPATAIAPTMENAVTGLYPLARLLYVYSAGTPTDLEKEYLDFVRSPEGQRIIEEVGYYPLPDELPELFPGAGAEAEADEPTEVAAAEGETAVTPGGEAQPTTSTAEARPAPTTEGSASVE